MKKIILIVAGLGLGAGLIFFFLINRQPESSPQKQDLTVLAQQFFDNLASGNYQEASDSFDNQMKEAMPPEALANLHSQINEKIGPLVNLGNPQVTEENGNWILEYQAVFGQEETVTIRLVFSQEGKNYQIAGLWLDSPKLRN
jgi:hypothetical protein